MGAKGGPQLTEKGYSQQANFLKIENLSTLIRPQQGGMWDEAISNGGKKGILAAATPLFSTPDCCLDISGDTLLRDNRRLIGSSLILLARQVQILDSKIIASNRIYSDLLGRHNSCSRPT